MHGKIKDSSLGTESEGCLARIPIIGRGGAHSARFPKLQVAARVVGRFIAGPSQRHLPPCTGTHIQIIARGARDTASKTPCADASERGEAE
jgi:hypothetical protein